MLRYMYVLTFLAISLLLVLGCTDRGDSITKVSLGDLESTSGLYPDFDHSFDKDLCMQIRNPDELLLGSAFLPKEVFPPVKPVPLLVLLAPERGDKLHYFKAGLETLMREMIAKGEIEPMAVYCVGNDQTFGGYFYGNNCPVGFYDSILGPRVMPWLSRDVLPAVDDRPSQHGIGGIGQGAYGAFRTAIKNPGAFSSITVTDGPLDFDGPDYDSTGLMSLFDSALAEQEAFYQTRPISDTFPEFSYHRDFDSSRTMPISMMFIGGSLAFSPNDTAYTFTRTVLVNNNTIRIDLMSEAARAAQMIAGPLGGDSTTYIWKIVKSQDNNWAFHLPFDSLGKAYAPAWNRWMANNLENMYTAAGGDALDGVNVWVASNPNAKFHYYEQTQSWLSFLRSEQVSVTEYPYSSFGSDPITQDEYLYDLLREMLIFHSDNFKNADDM
jgi:hypothetical protein